MKQVWNNYDPNGFYDELMAGPQQPHSFSDPLVQHLQALNQEEFEDRVNDCETEMRERGITFTVYSDAGNIDGAWPFDIIPRVIPKAEWDRTEIGLKQ